MNVRQRSTPPRMAGSLMMMPRRAASEIAPMIATGMAISRGQGVAMTSTARNRVPSPLRPHETAARPKAATVYHAPNLRPFLLPRLHNPHDSGITRIHWQTRRSDRKDGVTVDAAGKYLRSRDLRHLKGLSGQVSLVHGVRTF